VKFFITYAQPLFLSLGLNLVISFQSYLVTLAEWSSGILFFKKDGSFLYEIKKKKSLKNYLVTLLASPPKIVPSQVSLAFGFFEKKSSEVFFDWRQL
jgi:hypothetical protein